MSTFNALAVRGGSQQWEEYAETESPSYSGTRTSLSCQRRFRVPEDDFDAFLAELYPVGQTLTGEHPQRDGLYVDTFTAEPEVGPEAVEAATGVVGPQFYEFTVTYTPWESQDLTTGVYDPGEQNNVDLLIGNFNFRVEAMTLPGTGFKWASDNANVKKNELNPVMMIPILDFSLSIPRAPFIPAAAIRANIGKVNETAIWGATAETLLFLGTSARYRFNSLGQKLFDLEHRFSEKRIPNGSTPIGDYMGWASSYATLPVTSVRYGAVSEGDYAFLSQKDGSNLRGEYTYTSGAYVYGSPTSAYGWNHYMNPDSGEWDKLQSRVDDSLTYKYAPNFNALLVA